MLHDLVRGFKRAAEAFTTKSVSPKTTATAATSTSAETAVEEPFDFCFQTNVFWLLKKSLVQMPTSENDSIRFLMLLVADVATVVVVATDVTVVAIVAVAVVVVAAS